MIQLFSVKEKETDFNENIITCKTSNFYISFAF